MLTRCLLPGRGWCRADASCTMLRLVLLGRAVFWSDSNADGSGCTVTSLPLSVQQLLMLWLLAVCMCCSSRPRDLRVLRCVFYVKYQRCTAGSGRPPVVPPQLFLALWVAQSKGQLPPCLPDTSAVPMLQTHAVPLMINTLNCLRTACPATRADQQLMVCHCACLLYIGQGC